MRLVVMLFLVVTACGKGSEGWVCSGDADCNAGLRCGLIETGDGDRRTMCVNPDGVLNPTQTPKSYRSYAPALIAGAAVLVAALMLRSSVRARRKRKREKSA